jgi:cobalamin biosynthesis Mg chelatase CobN
MSNIEKYVYYWTVADAYTSEIERRATNEILIKRAIIKGDVKELKSLRSNAVVTELKDQIDEAIKSIEQAKKDEANRTEEERKAKALADAEAKALAEAIKKAEAELAAAKTDEEKAAAQAKLQGLKNSGSNGAGTGLPKMAIYGGIALVVAIGAYFMFRKKD